MNWGRAVAVWALIAVAESIHGTLRRLFVVPALGELRSHQLGVLVGCGLILLISWLSARWLGARTTDKQIKVGVLWLVLILIFEFSLGLAFGMTWERMLADYDLSQGGLMLFGLAFLLAAPTLGAKLARVNAHPVDSPGAPRT